MGANATNEPVDLEPPESLTNNSGMGAIVRAMQRPDSNLEVRDRMWLKIKISNAFIGSDVVDWLFERVQGFSDRREARKYASQMLKAGFIKHTVNKTSFSEQCYYTFGDDAQLNAGNEWDHPVFCTDIVNGYYSFIVEPIKELANRIHRFKGWNFL